MKVKSKQTLEQYANFIFQDMEKNNLKPCEMLYVMSDIQKTLSLVLLKKEID